MNVIEQKILYPLYRRVLKPMRLYMGGALIDCGNFVLGEHDRFSPPRRFVHVGNGNFQAIGNKFLCHFTTLGGLTRNAQVLDIGSGIGRMARPLIDFLDPERGSYHGIDVVPEGIAWCQKNITPYYPNFHFHVADIENKHYNPDGKFQASEYRFPFEDESFDFILLTSVFTHLLPADAAHYINEISRLLRKGGKVFCTWYLLNEESENLIAEHAARYSRGVPPIKYPVDETGVCKTAHVNVPEQVVGYAEGHVIQSFEQAGLSGVTIHYGGWCSRKKYIDWQDIVVASKV